MAKENNNTEQIQTPSALTALTDILQLVGVLISGDVNINNDGQVKKSVNTAATNGAKKKKGIFGYLDAIEKKNQVIINKLNWDPKIFNEIHESLKKDGPIVKSLSENIPKKIDDITKRLDLIVAAVTPTAAAEPSGGENAESSTSTATKGSSNGGDILDVLKTIGGFKYNGHKEFEQLAEDTRQGGVIWETFNNINELNNMNIDADKFKQTMDKINETKGTATAIGTENSTKQLNTASDENEKYLIYLFGILTIGGMLILVGYLHDKLDINAIMQFSAVLMGFLVMTAGVFIAASVLLNKNSATMNGLEAFGNLIAVAGGLLLAGGLLMEIIKVPLLITFATILYLFVVGVMHPFIWANKQLDGNYSSIEKLTDAIVDLVVTSSVIMLLGSFIIEYIDLGNLFKFTLVLGAFIFGMLLIFKMTNAMLKKGLPAYDGMKDALKLVIGSAFIMFLGAALMPLINWGNVVKFILCLGTFLFGLIIIFRVLHFLSTVGGGDGKVKQPVGMKDALWLVLGSAFIMFLGAEIIKHVNVGYLFLFTITLGLFLAAVLAPYMILKSVMHTLAPTIKATVWLVVVSAAVLFIGGALLHEYPWLIGYVTLFGVMLLGFIGGLMFIYKTFGVGIKRSLSTAQGMLLLTVVSAAILFVGGYLLYKQPNLIWAIPVFGVLLLGFMTVMGIIIFGFSQIPEKNMAKTLAAAWQMVGMMAAISGIFMVLGGVYALIESHGGMLPFTGFMIIIGISLVAFAGFLSKIGKTMEGAGTGVLYAIGIILAVAGSIWLIADAILRISDAIDRMSHISSFDPKPIFTAIYTITDIIWNLLPLTVFVLPLLAVETTILTLTFLIERIADAVKNVAELTIPIYVGTKVVGYRKLETADFGLAATNVSLLVTTLTTGIMQAYEQHPEWYDSAGSPWLLLGGVPGAILYAGLKMMGNSPLEKVIKQSQGLAPVISKISEAVKDYADLKIREYDAKGNPMGYRRLTSKDFDNAAKNVSLLVTTLTLGIMGAYEEHPEWYGVADWSSFFESMGNWGKTPLERVIAQSKALGSLISKIASGVGNLAQLKVETRWDPKTGDPIEFRQLNDSDFNKASVNIARVVTTLTSSLMKVYELNSDWYQNGGFLGLGDSPFEKVINTNKELGKLISDIANSVQNYANLKMPLKYDNNGKAIEFRPMTDADFTTAAANVNKVLSTLGSAIMNVYESHNAWFKGSWGGLGDSPFEDVLEVNKELASLVSSVANSVKNFADLKIAVGYNEKGEATAWRRMDENDFTNAARCISTVVTTLATGLNDGYTNMNLSDEDTYERFDRVLDVSTKIAGIVSTMANHISKLSNMQIPDDWNKETGEPTHYKEMNTDDFIKAANCITTVITTFATGIFYAFDPNRKDGLNGADGNIISKFMGIKVEGGQIKITPWEETAAYSVLTASENISKVISSIANTVSNFASSKFPTAFDKNGNPTNYVPLGKAELDTATTNIMDVVKAAAHALHDLLEDTKAKEFFEISPEIPENPSLKESITGGIKNIFKKTNPSKLELVLGASSQIASVIKMIAEALVMYAGGTVAADGKPIIINDTVITAAKNTIKEIIPAMKDAVVEAAADAKFVEMMENNTLQPTINAITSLTSIVAVTAKTIQDIAGLRIPTKWDPETGEPIDWIPMGPTQFNDATAHIKTIVTTMAGALQEIFDDNKYPWLKEIDDSLVSMIFGHPLSGNSTKSSFSVLIILKSVFTLAQAIDVISRCIVGYATMRFPTGELDDKGHPVLGKLSLDQIPKAKEHIVTVVTSMCDAMNQITNSESLKNLDEDDVEEVTEKIKMTTDNLHKIIGNIKKVYDKILSIDSKSTDAETTTSEPSPTGTSTSIEALLKYFPKDGKSGFTLQLGELLSGISVFYKEMSLQTNEFFDFNNDDSFENTMTKIGTGLNTVGTSIGLIYSSMKDIDAAKVLDFSSIGRLNKALQTFATNTKANTAFKNNINELDRFSKVVTSLQVNSGLDKMNTFITSLNELANKMGNLDGLTDAIANKLSKALEELVTRLEEAEAAITQADNIHEERRKLIKESVEKISELMKQPMTVEIQQVATQTTDESTNNTTTTT